MADVAKTVSIIFEGDSSSAQKSVEDLVSATSQLGSGGGTGGLADDIKGVGDSAGEAGPSLAQLGDKLRELATDAGVPKEALDGVEKILARVGGGAGSTALVAAGALAAFGLAFVSAGSEARDFKQTLENVSGGTLDAERAFQVASDAADLVGASVGEMLDLYGGFLQEITQTGTSVEVAEKAFTGISNAIDAVGGDSTQAKAALDAFSKIARDGEINLKDLNTTITKIPGGLRILSEALGVPVEDVRLLAEQNKLGREEIELFANALNNQEYKNNIGPVGDAFADLMNTIKRFALDLGAEDAIQFMLEAVATAIKSVTLATSVSVDVIKLFGATLANIAFTLTSLDFSGFTARQNEIITTFETSVGKATDKFTGLQETVAKADTAPASKAYADMAAKLRETGDSATATGDAYKTLGIDVAKVNANVIGALETLVGSAKSTGKEITEALKVTIPKISDVGDLERFAEAAAQAARDGKITWEQWAVQVDKASESFVKNTGQISTNSDAVKKQAEEVKKAEENASKLAIETQKLHVEMEKLASDERIKSMEFKASIDIANIQANAQKVIAAFDSINNTVNSTADVIGKIFDQFKDINGLDSAARNALFAQLDVENKIRREAFELQKLLTTAQVDNLNAQTRNLQSGNALIKVDGAGLQPHLEAFMWEILRAIQIRVNSQGMKLLLGV